MVTCTPSVMRPRCRCITLPRHVLFWTNIKLNKNNLRCLLLQHYTTTFLVATMWIAGKPPDVVCCHIHTYTVQSSLRVTYAVYHHTCHTISQRLPYYPRWPFSLLNYYRFCKVWFDLNIRWLIRKSSNYSTLCGPCPCIKECCVLVW